MTTEHGMVLARTLVEESPAAAQKFFDPLADIFLESAMLRVDDFDITLSGRILAAFGYGPDDLSRLGDAVKKPGTMVLKLPNVSATVPQVMQAIKDLRAQGFELPDYNDAKEKYDGLVGSIVNPVLRQGNSERFPHASIKAYTQKHPHAMGTWSPDSKTRVVHMDGGDFKSSEQSVTMDAAKTLHIEFIDGDKNVTRLKTGIKTTPGSIIDAAFMNRTALREFYDNQFAAADRDGIMPSIHLKATMMTKTDGEFLGDAIQSYYADLFETFGDELKAAGVEPKNGMNALRDSIKTLPAETQGLIHDEIARIETERADLPVIDPATGKKNLDDGSMIIDISMANLVRWAEMSGQDTDGKTTYHDTRAIIPDSTYAGAYARAIDDMKRNGAIDPATCGSVRNIGLSAEGAEEYGSKDTTFEAPTRGYFRVVDDTGNVVSSHYVRKGDIWRMSHTTYAAIENWIEIGLRRTAELGQTGLFWLDENRAHDKEMIKAVNAYLSTCDVNDIDLRIMSPEDAMEHTLTEMRKGNDIISITGNVWRDYLTDLFPILELGSNSKMMSLVHMLNGDIMAETGAGGTAADLYQKLRREGILKWDSIAEFQALQILLDTQGQNGDEQAQILADTLSEAIMDILDKKLLPSAVPDMDTREHHIHLATHWAAALARQDNDLQMKERFTAIHEILKRNSDTIIAAIRGQRGQKIEMGGHFTPHLATLLPPPYIETLHEMENAR